MVGGGVAMLGGRRQCRAELVFIFFFFLSSSSYCPVGYVDKKLCKRVRLSFLSSLPLVVTFSVFFFVLLNRWRIRVPHRRSKIGTYL